MSEQFAARPELFKPEPLVAQRQVAASLTSGDAALGIDSVTDAMMARSNVRLGERAGEVSEAAKKSR